ncbi:unnamed protein product, partial [Brassica napus]
ELEKQRINKSCTKSGQHQSLRKRVGKTEEKEKSKPTYIDWGLRWRETRINRKVSMKLMIIDKMSKKFLLELLKRAMVKELPTFDLDNHNAKLGPSVHMINLT